MVSKWKVKQALVKAVITRLKPNKNDNDSPLWKPLHPALWKMTIDELSILEELISGHQPDVPDRTCI